MRFAGVLVSAILLSCLFIQTHAIDPGDIAAPSMNVPNMDMPKPLITAPNMNVPEPKTKTLEKPINNQNQAVNQTGNSSSNQTPMTQIQQEVEPTDMSGKWSIKFNDGTDRSLILNLWSSGKTRMMGYGTLTDQGVIESVTASGSVFAEELVLTVKSGAPEYANSKSDEYNLDLFMANNTMSGTYILEASDQSLSTGNVTAVRQ
jgi:hypothetical protein